MKYARDTRPFSQPTQMAELLSETLPWIKNIAGKTVVIKYGGAAMENAALQNAVMSDIVLLKLFGVNPIIVHGGGKAINRAMAAQHLEVQFANGRRVTTPETMEVVRQVLVGEVNQDLVRAVNAHGNLAVGVSGADAGTFVARQLDPELGRVGEITKVNTGYLEDLIRSEYIPVVATVALGDDGGYYNVNADTAAGYVAAALGAHKIVFLTDVDGLYEDFDDKSSLISNMTLDECRSLRDSGTLASGMIPKIDACIRALEAGVFRAHIINGTTAHSLLIELLTDEGVGTVVHATQEAYELDTHPLGKVAARLMVNLSEEEARKGLA